MKKLVIILSVFIYTTSLSAQFKSASLTAAGLTCAMCSKSIHDALKQLPFVSAVKPDIKNSGFEISFRESSAVNFDQIKKAVEDAGFSVAKLKVLTAFKNLAVNNDTHVQLGGKTLHFLKIPASVLDGERSLIIVDKNFLNAKEQKKYLSATSMACVNTGHAASCCSKGGIAEGSRIYHVTI
jgi:copper chaperone CopZ